MKELDPIDIELIEKYFSQTCTRNEEQLFLEKEKSDPLFREKAELFKSIYENAGIDSDNFESVLDEIHNELKEELSDEETFVRPLATQKWQKIAAAVLLILVAAVVVNLWLQPTNPMDLYSSHFQIPPENITVRDINEDNSNLSQALQFYKDGLYLEASKEFSDYLDTNENHPGARFYLAISLMETGDYEKALSEFDEIIGQSDHQYRPSAQWYAGLAALRLEKINIAQRHFTSLADGTGSYAARSKEILKKLK